MSAERVPPLEHHSDLACLASAVSVLQLAEQNAVRDANRQRTEVRQGQLPPDSLLLTRAEECEGDTRKRRIEAEAAAHDYLHGRGVEHPDAALMALLEADRLARSPWW